MKQRRSKPESIAPYVVTAEGAAPVLSDHGVDRLLVQPVLHETVDEPPEAMPIHGIWLGVGAGIMLWLALVGVALGIWSI